jgi:hypothetical protein
VGSVSGFQKKNRSSCIEESLSSDCFRPDVDTFMDMQSSEQAWITLGAALDHAVSWGAAPGQCHLETVTLPPVLDEGMVLRLLCTGALREGQSVDLASGAVWEVSSVQEKSKYVPGQRVWLHPAPPCGICPACLAGCAVSCRDSHRQTAFPGWMSSVRVLHPWAVRRGVVPVPSTVGPDLFTLLVPMARAMRVRRTISRRDRVLVVGNGIQALLVGAALDGPGRRALVNPNGDLQNVGSFGFQHSGTGLEPMREALQGEPDLVVVVDGSADLLEAAVHSAGLGTTVVAMSSVPAGDRFSQLWEKQTTLMFQRGIAPEDLVPARNRIVEIARTLDAVPRSVVAPELWEGRETLEALWTVIESCAPSC